MLGVDVATMGEGDEAIKVGKDLVEQEIKEVAEKEGLENTENKVVEETGYYADEHGNVLSKNQDGTVKSLEKGGYDKVPLPS